LIVKCQLSQIRFLRTEDGGAAGTVPVLAKSASPISAGEKGKDDSIPEKVLFCTNQPIV
jgi:hypothetical protein